MSEEYVEGKENIYLVIKPAAKGMVRLAVFQVGTNEKIYGVVLPAEIARQAAMRLTISSWEAEEMAT